MLGYAKQFKDKIHAQGREEGREEVVKALQEAQKKGIPLEQVLEIYKTKNRNKTNGNDQ